MSSILKVDTIQDQDGNNIINESANTITIGASGDTITIPSGATLANSGIVTGFESTGIDDNATSTAITIDSSENVGINVTNPGSFYSGSNNLVVKDGISIFDTTDSRLEFVDGTSGSEAYVGNIVYNHTSDFMRFNVNVSERMRIDSSGNVGIGTTSPTAKIHGIVGTDWNSTNYSFIFQNQETQNSYGNTVRIIGGGGSGAGHSTSNILAVGDNDDNIDFVVRGDGNVGIGTSSPDAKLSVNGVASFGDGTESSPSITNFGDLNTGIYFPAADKIAFSTNGDETIRVDANGVFTVNRGKSTNGGLLLLSKNPISVSTSATDISATSSYGSLAFVWGVSGGNIFHDLVSWSLSSVDVLASQNVSASPAGRTYSASSGVLRVAMASGTYSVYESDIRTQTS